MDRFVLLLVPLPFVAFWFLMFRDMLNNHYLAGDAKYNWTLAFIFMNVFAAMLYYANVYRNR